MTMPDITGYVSRLLGIRGFKTSAMSFVFWLNIIVTVPCLGIFAAHPSGAGWAAFGLAVLVVLYSLYEYDRLSRKDPRLVQSEWYQIEQRKLDIVAEKGGPIVFDTVNLPLTEDPKQLTGGSESSPEGAEE